MFKKSKDSNKHKRLLAMGMCVQWKKHELPINLLLKTCKAGKYNTKS